MNFGVLRRGPRFALRNAEGEESAINPTALINSLPLLNRTSTIVLSVGSSLTGAGTVMLGVILPALSQRWGLRDDQAGFLMFLQFFASGLGALVTGMNRVRSMAIGYGLLVATLCALVVGEKQFAYVAFFFYGLGLGIAITSTSLFFSDRWGSLRATKLVWLSFAWSAGATAGPVCILPLLHRGDFGSVFLMMLILFLAMFVWVILVERQGPAAALVQRTQRLNRSVQTVFSILLVLAMSFVGVEAVLSGWLTTYSHRAGIRDLAGAALATSIFWLGEMLSRLAFSTRLLTKVGGRKVMMWGSAGVTLSTILLIAFPHPWVIFLVAGAAGAFVGPLYPLSLSYLLELSPKGWFFAMGGIGAAIFPWITGLVSAHYHSLRCGLAVPVVAGLGMIMLIVLTFRRLQPVGTSNPVLAESS
ncbi:MAG: MFS transporter [Candidatus Korobacteraceae bacterium]|jgi:MFS transporter, FHS family, glucose/mannose:H+ symporter